MRHIWWVSAAILLVFMGFAQAEGAPTLGSDDIVLGKANAPITIFEYASLTCPHCAEFDKETFPKVKSLWIDTGKAKLVFRDFPLDGSALKAAMVARCAPPGEFFGFIDVLFKNQASWEIGTEDQVNDALQRIALLGGISADKYKQCIADKSLNDRILGERLQAQNDYGVDSTPTFFINGKKVVGALPYDEFAKELSAASADAGGTTRFAATFPPATRE